MGEMSESFVVAGSSVRIDMGKDRRLWFGLLPSINNEERNAEDGSFEIFPSSN